MITVDVAIRANKECIENIFVDATILEELQLEVRGI